MAESTENGIPIGAIGTIDWVTQPEQSAIAVGSGAVETFSTPSLLALMEAAAVKAIAPYLEDGQTSVGISAELTHSAATPIGQAVSAEATVESVDGRKVTFEVIAQDVQEPIGRCTHTRFIVEKATFESRLARKAA